jgi:leucine dehydrogenase
MIIREIHVDGYERVAKATDPETGLVAFIAVHSTVLGPAIGGIRMWPYASEKEALTDVLRLAQGMSFKSAVADTGLGGGKSVIIGDSRTQKTEALFEAMGRFVNVFDGTYYPAEDVGTTVENLEWVARTSQWVAGLPIDKGGSGNPSRYTALGTFLGVQACLEEVFGTPDLAGRTVAIQGVGSVGARVARHLAKAGAALVLADVHQDAVAALSEELQAEVVAPERIYDVTCDVFSPHALGSVINDKTLPRLRCPIVAGAANNQLERDEHGEVLRKRGIVYAPDFVINAGGIINVGCEFLPGGYDPDVALDRVHRIHDAVAEVLRVGKEKGISTHQAALEVARLRIMAGPRA